MNKVLVSPIAFNEHGKLEKVIARYLNSSSGQNSDYLIVDDASDDGTTNLIARFACKGVKTIRHTHRRGVGAAIRTVINYAKDNDYDVLVIMAGNDKDNPQEISRLVDPILNEGYDFVQGSRYKEKNGIGGDMPQYRVLATKFHPWLMSLITGTKVTDSTNGFRAFRPSIFKNYDININQTWLDHYELEPYLLYKAITLGLKFCEAPVTKIYPSKKLGYTKMKPLIGLSIINCIPEKKFSNVGCSANATAREPTPKDANNGVIDTPKLSIKINRPRPITITRINPRATLPEVFNISTFSVISGIFISIL